MTHSNDSQRARRRRRQLTAAVILLAGVGWARHVSADPGRGAARSGRIGARVYSLAIDPDTPTTLYAGGECSGVFKSVDGGDSWITVNTGLPYDSPGWEHEVRLVMDPITPTILYAWTGTGVFRSSNGGASWSQSDSGLTYRPVTAIVIDPATPSVLYAAAGDVFRSLNGADSWQPTDRIGYPIRALAIGATTPSTLYAGAEAGIFKSRDGGDSWTAAFSDWGASVLATSSAAPAVVYAASQLRMFRSLNAGNNWEELGLAEPVSAIAIDPATPTILYAGAIWGGGVFKSVNGGESWREINTGLPDQWDVTALAINPAMPTTVYAAGWPDSSHEGGVLKSLNGGDSWQATGLGGKPCGDGFVGCGEQCDDANTNDNDACRNDCRLNVCGDGSRNPATEQCDDGNRNPFDGCTNDCMVCGDGILTPPEECDDGDTISDANCDAQCRRPRVVGNATPQSCTESAFAAALAERSVRFNCGPAPVTITLTSEKAISVATTIDGGGLVTLSGGGAVRIFNVAAGAGLEVRNLTIADGHADDGGAIYNSGMLVLTNCTLSGNSGYFSGAIYNEGALTLTNCTMNGNSAELLAGAIFSEGTLTLTNCTMNGNSAEPVAGAIFSKGALTLTNCTLSGNSGAWIIWTAEPGGGAFGGYRCDSVTVTNSTFSGNDGGAIAGYCAASVTNSIFANSCGAIMGSNNLIVDGGHNLQFSGTSCGETIPSLDPKLDPAGLKDNGGPTQTIALLPNSPAINAGDPEVCANSPVNGVDQRGLVRPGTGHTQCSIGAYEADAVSPEPCIGDCDGTASATIDELITLVHIAQGNAQASACPHGVPSGADVDVALILQAVNAAMSGCAG